MVCGSVRLSVSRSVLQVTHSFNDQPGAPYWPTWPCFISFLSKLKNILDIGGVTLWTSSTLKERPDNNSGREPYDPNENLKHLNPSPHLMYRQEPNKSEGGTHLLHAPPTAHMVHSIFSLAVTVDTLGGYHWRHRGDFSISTFNPPNGPNFHQNLREKKLLNFLIFGVV